VIKEYLQCIESVDENNRVLGIRFYRVFDESLQGVFQSHTISYPKGRAILQDVSGGEPFGLEREVYKPDFKIVENSE